MGLISKIRQISPYVFIVFAVLFITFMVLSDNVSNLAGSGESMQTAAICEINGEKIYYKDYEERVKERVEMMQNDPQNQNNEVDEPNIRKQVWDEMLREILLKQASENLGISVSDEEILDILIENPPDYLKGSFTDENGVFNRQLYLEILTNPESLVNYLGQDPTQIDAETKARQVAEFRNQIIMITEYLKMQKMTEIMSNTINTAFAVSSPTYIEQKFVDENSTADINYIYVGLNSVTDSVDVTDAEIKEYFDKNKSNFKSKNQRKVKTITFPVFPSAEDSLRNNRRIERIQNELSVAQTIEQKDSIFSVKLNEYSGTENDWQMLQDVNPQVSAILANAVDREIVGPIQMPDGIHFYRLDGRRAGEQEVVKASHILISFNENKDSAKAEAQKIMREANAANFAELAMKHSQDKGSGSQGGDLGYFGKGRMVPEFETAAFGAKIGSIVGPIESQFGYHIIRVVDKKSDELKYSFIALQQTVSGATKNKIKRDAFAAMKQVEAGENIDSLAKKLLLNCAESPLLAADRPYQNSMFLTNKIFEVKLGDVLEPKEVSNGNAVIVSQVSEIRKAGLSTLENETEQIKRKLLKIKKLDKVKEKAEQIFNVVKNNSSLAEINKDSSNIVELPFAANVANATIKNNGAIPGIGSDFVATTQSFLLPTNKINSPIRGENGYFIIEVKSREIPTSDKAKDAQDLTKAQYTRSLFENWFNKFKEDSEIVDLRNKYYTEY
jgi:parvulin-like peptidyl-prolyl isomerase